jgi:parvulin-like peptidyl-prolyl isomerase
MIATSHRRPLRAVVPLLALLAIALVVSACGGGKKEATGNDVVVVGNQQITVDQLNTLLNSAKATFQQRKQAFPKVGSPQYTQLQQQAVQQLVQAAQIEVGAQQLGITVSPSEVQARLQTLKQQYFPGKTKGSVDEAKYQQAIKAQGLSEAQLADRVRQQVLEKKVYDKVSGSATISQSDIQAYYNQNKATAYTKAKSRHVRHILVSNKALANQLYSQLQSSDKSFATLAKKYSKDTVSAKNGGDLGVISYGNTVPQFQAVAFSEPAHVVSKPVKTTYGYHLIEALGPVQPRKVQPLTAALSATIRKTVETQKKSQTVNAWFTKLTQDLKSKTVYAKGYAPPAPTPTTPANGSTTTTGG